jgi:hypothetical protein
MPYRLADGEASMSVTEVAAAMGILFALGMGIVIGIVFIVSIASRREERLFSLWGKAPDPACQGARRLLGVWVRGERPERAFYFDEDDAMMRQEHLR